MADYDLIIRGGSIADGAGGDLFEGDVAVKDGKIAAVGQVSGSADEEIDARGKLVTPGFVDIHTHYDGQVTWDHHLSPSSNHGVTTVLMGNCGVGFAPCRPEQREAMMDVMEGVEDIPGVVMAEGLPWNWTTFPEYLDAIEKRPMDVDFAAQVPHIPIRVYVMGKRGIARETARPEDIRAMADLVKEGLEAGALGFSTSRVNGHKTAGGDVVPSTTASEDELMGIALAMKEAGKGTFMTAAEFDTSNGYSAEFNMLRRIAEMSGRTVFFPLLQYDEAPDRWFEVAEACADARAHGVDMYGQVVARPVGLLYGLELSSHPFVGSATYKSIKHLPLAERVAAMRDPETRRKILADDVVYDDERVIKLARMVEDMYVMGDPPNYSPSVEDRFDNVAARRGVSPYEVAYDALLEHEGRGVIYHPARNFTRYNLDTVLQMMQRKDTIIGLGDGGAHLGRICDGSMPTFMLTYWTRDRAGERLSVPFVVQSMTSETARVFGFHDRGLLKPGYKADINVIDYDNLRLHPPHAIHDLPAGGTRLFQEADGYVATVLSGVVTFRDGQPTGALPGKLVRGAQPAPAAA